MRLGRMETYTVTILENTKRVGIRGICAPTIDEAERILELVVAESAYPTFEELPESIKFYVAKSNMYRNIKLVIGGKRFSMEIKKVGSEVF